MGLGFRAGARVRDGARGKGGGGSAAPSCRRVAAISGVHESRLTERTWTRGGNEGTCRPNQPHAPGCSRVDLALEMWVPRRRRGGKEGT